MSNVDISAHYWFMLRARPNRVFKAAAALQDIGLVTALPYEWRSRRRGSRHCKSVTRLPQAQLASYLMTGFDTPVPSWRMLFEDPTLAPLLSGVVSVTSDGLPTPIRTKEIFKQQLRYGAQLYELPPKSIIEDIESQQLQVGDQVRVGQWRRWSRGQEEFDQGGFVGKIVTITEIDGDTAKVLLPMFGVGRVARVPIDHLAAA